MDAQLLNSLVQGGSFAVLVLIILWFGVRAIPSALSVHQTTIKELTDNFRDELRIIHGRHDAATDKRDQQFATFVTALTELTHEIRIIREETARTQEDGSARHQALVPTAKPESAQSLKRPGR